jgi:hypothetical protein
MDIASRHESDRGALDTSCKKSKLLGDLGRHLKADKNPDLLRAGHWPFACGDAGGGLYGARIGHGASNAAITSATIRSSSPS